MYLVNNINGIGPYECYIQLRNTNKYAITVWLYCGRIVWIDRTAFNYKDRMSSYPSIPIGHSVSNK